MDFNEYTLLIPVAPQSVNDAMSFSQSQNELYSLKKRWEKIAMVYLRDAVSEGTMPESFYGRAEFTFILYFEYYRKRDQDNYFAMAKGIMDAFVKTRVIEDDTSECVKFDGIDIKYNKDRPCVEVKIIENYESGRFIAINHEFSNGESYEQVANRLESSGKQEEIIGTIFDASQGLQTVSKTNVWPDWDDYGSIQDLEFGPDSPEDEGLADEELF